MVLKRSKGGLNTGGTVKDYTSYLEKDHDHFKNYFIRKYFFRKKDSDRENDDILREIENLVGIQDGGLEFSRRYGSNRQSQPIYSLNKRKRWLLVEPLKGAIDQCDEGKPWKIVLHECVLPVWTNSSFAAGGNTAAVHDSSLPKKHNYSRKKCSAIFSDLYQNSSVENDRSNTKKKARKKLGHSRGVQRVHMENCMNCRNNNGDENNNEIPRQWRWRHRDILHGTGPGLPEVRYEVTSPMKRTSERAAYLHYGSKKWAYGSAHGCTKAYCKSKGLKVGEHDYYYWKSMEKRDKLDEEDRGRFMDDDDLYIENHDRCSVDSKINENISISLEDFLNPRRSRQHAKRNNSNNISSIHPNKASPYLCVPHPKGSAVHEVISEPSSSGMGKHPVSGKDNVTIPTGHETDKIVNSHLDFLCSQNWAVCNLKKSDYECMMKHRSVIYEDVELTVSSSSCLPRIHSIDFQPVIGMMDDRVVKGRDTSRKPTHAYMLIRKDLTRIVDWPDTTDEPYETVRILLLANSNKISDKLNWLQEQLTGSSTILTLSSLISLVKDVVKECVPKTNRTKEMSVRNLLNDELIRTICGHQVDVCSVTDAFVKSTQHSYSKSISFTSFPEDSINEEYICDICLSDMGEFQNESSLYMIQLLPCRHSFCANCWSHHIIQRIRFGDTLIACQAFKCDSVMDKTTVMGLTPLDLFLEWERRKKEKQLESTEQWKYCPNPSCSKVAKITKSGYIGIPCSVPVRCDCGEKWCYSCGQLSHWPASCQQASWYLKMLKQNGDEQGKVALVGSSTFFVDVKKCPKCKYPMEKNGGCSHMHCKCGHSFCWECLGDWREHLGYGLACVSRHIKETTVELETSISYPLPTLYYKHSVTHRHKWHSLTNRHPNISPSVKTYLSHLCSKRLYKCKETSSVFDSFAELVKFGIQLSQMLEYMYVILSNMTKSTSNGHFSRMVSQLDFIAQRIEVITKKQNPSVEDCERGQTLKSIAEKILKLLAKRMSKIQKNVTQVQQKMLLNKAENLAIMKSTEIAS